MSAHRAQNYRTMYVCLDNDPELLEGEGANTDGALMYHTTVNCNRRDIPCPPYENRKELACAVCTK